MLGTISHVFGSKAQFKRPNTKYNLKQFAPTSYAQVYRPSCAITRLWLAESWGLPSPCFFLLLGRFSGFSVKTLEPEDFLSTIPLRCKSSLRVAPLYRLWHVTHRIDKEPKVLLKDHGESTHCYCLPYVPPTTQSELHVDGSISSFWQGPEVDYKADRAAKGFRKDMLILG
ncbi:hypothetical protein P167DRAFT_541524 [Morchella conica CCBAS932]|uniref:Uncharacterized protein n=1 Tax=Morchella conica CCBAS932 TaxID=1392247 RepID=A0A3N4L4P9_9PEZI|nr:hypothetical protein P167DRAFT_541524 [Morchella conica CCBAS932]